MRMKREMLLLYAVTDGCQLREKKLAEQVEEALMAGVTMLQLRDKERPDTELAEEAKELHKITKRYGVPLIINDNIEAALAADAEGVHLGQEDEAVSEARRRLGEGKIIGVSAHTVEEALAAQARGADYLGVGAVFGSRTKKDAVPVSRDTLSAICEAVTIPVVAIGGISKNNIEQLSKTGIDGVAVISAIFSQENIKEAAGELLQLARQTAGWDRFEDHEPERIG